MNSKSTDNRTSSIVLIISFSIFVLTIFLIQWDALTAAYYNGHEMLYGVYGLSLFVLPIEGIVWFVFWSRHIRSKVRSGIAIKILNTFSLLLAAISIVLPVIGLTTSKTGGCTIEIEKYSYENQYYVNLDNRSIRVSKNKYDEIEDGIVQGYVYTFEFSHNDLLLGRDNVFFVEIEKLEF